MKSGKIYFGNKYKQGDDGHFITYNKKWTKTTEKNKTRQRWQQQPWPDELQLRAEIASFLASGVNKGTSVKLCSNILFVWQSSNFSLFHLKSTCELFFLVTRKQTHRKSTDTNRESKRCANRINKLQNFQYFLRWTDFNFLGKISFDEMKTTNIQ